VPVVDPLIRVEIKGLKELQRENEQLVRDLSGPPLALAMSKAVLIVERAAKIGAPVNTGRLRASITPEVRPQARNVQGIVGTNVAYAAPVEYGSRAHWAPIAPLIRWAHLKKLAGTYSLRTKRRIGGAAQQETEDRRVAYIVQHVIARRGTRAQPFLEPAFTNNLQRIQNLLGGAVSMVVSKWGKK